METLVPALGALGVAAGLWAKLSSIRRAHDNAVRDAAAREALQEHRISELEKWKDQRHLRDKEFFKKIDKLSEDVTWLKAHMQNGGDR